MGVFESSAPIRVGERRGFAGAATAFHLIDLE